MIASQDSLLVGAISREMWEMCIVPSCLGGGVNKKSGILCAAPHKCFSGNILTCMFEVMVCMPKSIQVFECTKEMADPDSTSKSINSPNPSASDASVWKTLNDYIGGA